MPYQLLLLLFQDFQEPSSVETFLYRAAIGGLLTVIGVLWKVYLNERNKRTETLETSIAAITESNLTRAASKDIYERNHNEIMTTLYRIEGHMGIRNQ